jgi:hypothetical protein
MVRKPTTEDVIKPASTIQPFHQVPGPKGLPIIGTLFDYFKKDGLRFSNVGFLTIAKLSNLFPNGHYNKRNNLNDLMSF